MSGVDQTTPEADVQTNSGTGTTAAVAVTAGSDSMSLAVVGNHRESPAQPLPSAPIITSGHTEAWSAARPFNGATAGAHGTAGTFGWEWTGSFPWDAIAVAVRAA